MIILQDVRIWTKFLWFVRRSYFCLAVYFLRFILITYFVPSLYNSRDFAFFIPVRYLFWLQVFPSKQCAEDTVCYIFLVLVCMWIGLYVCWNKCVKERNWVGKAFFVFRWKCVLLTGHESHNLYQYCNIMLWGRFNKFYLLYIKPIRV